MLSMSYKEIYNIYIRFAKVDKKDNRVRDRGPSHYGAWEEVEVQATVRKKVQREEAIIKDTMFENSGT